ncbi:AT-rich interactive domain-containing protein 5B [Saguinus oedipus]|uniref:AT-rich interactive domain-containing protein 5B n=1 Tax=Saguinus oedipus TaxID=9490 RepID=A0ABQ9UND7_SAGOE|nr:AT-rich interactive domain-containing protein 5B [Saguinus oedipus]
MKEGFIHAESGEDEEETNVIVLSYPQYCRYRSMLKRIQDKPSSILTDQFALALGGIAVVSRNPQILYCRDTFDHPTLIENESICDEFDLGMVSGVHCGLLNWIRHDSNSPGAAAGEMLQVDM